VDLDVPAAAAGPEEEAAEPVVPAVDPQILGPRTRRPRPLVWAQTPAAPGMHRAKAKATPHGAGGGAAAVAVAPREAPLHKIGHPIDRRILAGLLRRLSRIGTSHRAQPGNSEIAGGIEHR